MNRCSSALGALSLLASALLAACSGVNGSGVNGGGGCGEKPVGGLCKTAAGTCVDQICASGHWTCAAGQVPVASSPATCGASSGSPSSGGAGAQTTGSVSGNGSSGRCPTATWERPPACDADACSCDSVCAVDAGECRASPLTVTCGTTCRGSYTAWVPSPPSCNADADCVPRCMGWVCKDHECRRPDGGCTNDAQCACGTFCVIGGGYCVATGRLAP